MARIILTVAFRLLGVAVGLIAFEFSFEASMFRMEDPSEFSFAARGDAAIGCVSVVAFLCFRFPGPVGASKSRRAVTAAVALLIWSAVSGALVLHHWEQVLVRFS